jgi:uncharacterized protein (TIGR02118 family)
MPRRRQPRSRSRPARRSKGPSPRAVVSCHVGTVRLRVAEARLRSRRFPQRVTTCRSARRNGSLRFLCVRKRAAACSRWVEAMVKFMVVLYRRKDFSAEEFAANLRQIHGPVAERLPGLRRYVQNHVAVDSSRRHPGWDAVVELYWDDRASMESAWRSPEGAAATKHLEDFVDLSRSTWAVVDEEVRRP